MNPRVKQLWIDALRSGRYKQAREQLSTGKRMCCLGVLCDLHAEEVGGKWYVALASDFDKRAPHYLGESSVLPSEVIAWAELPDKNPKAPNRTLADMNDAAGASFADIADAIEKHL